jgi:hypothetical protein
MAELTEAFLEIAHLAERLGIANIRALPGCWEHQIDKRWWIAVNANENATVCSRGPTVPPYSAYVEFNGWPAGIINPRGGVIAAGAAANEDAFIAALKAANA